MKRFYLFLAVLLLALLLLPLFLESYWLGLFIIFFFYAYLGQCWNILSGYCGQLSLGHALYVGTGAYISTKLFMVWGFSPWLGMIVSGIVACVIGLLMGYLAFRFGLRWVYFLLLTIAFAEIGRIILLNWELFGSFAGMFVPSKPGIVNMQFESNIGYYYLFLGFMALSLVAARILEKTRLGKCMAAIREDEDAAESLGVNAFRTKMWAVGISSFMTSLAGTLYANYFFYLHPDILLSVHLSVKIMLAPIIGGLGTVFGPVIGAIFVGSLEELSRIYFSSEGLVGLNIIIYGLLLIIIVIFLPKGLMPLFRRLISPLLTPEGTK